LKWSPTKTYHREINLKAKERNTITVMNLTLTSLHTIKDKMPGIKLNMMHLTHLSSRNKLKAKPKELTMLFLNKDKINKIFTTLWLITMILLKNTTNSTLSKLLLITLTDYLKRNTITNGKPNPLSSHMSRETTLGTSMNTIKQTGINIRALHQKPTSKVLSTKSHIQLLKTHQEVLIQKTNSSNARTLQLRHSSTLSHQMRRDSQ
jgi:hypothetical protein